MEAARPGQKTTITCEVNGTVINGIVWLRPSYGTQHFFTQCSKRNDECTAPPGYSIVIDPATHKHTLTIDSFNTTLDVGNWTCKDHIHGCGHTTCAKEEASKSTYFCCVSVN